MKSEKGTEDGSVLSVPLGRRKIEGGESESVQRQWQSCLPMQTIRKMANYSPQVDEPTSFVDGPPPVSVSFITMLLRNKQKRDFNLLQDFLKKYRAIVSFLNA